MKYEVKGLTSYGVYDGDRLLGSYESEKTAELIAEALNEEEEFREVEKILTTHPHGDSDSFAAEAAEIKAALYQQRSPSNGQDKETI